LVTSGGRQGAFLGISVVYTGKYCVDVTSLYDLFEQVYNTIVQQGILLKSVNNQTVFCVHAFKDAESEINRIKIVLQKNLDAAFVNDFQPLDNKFKQGVNLDKVVELNNEVENEDIIRAFEEYPMISISPEFSGGIIETPPIDVLNEELAQIKREKKLLEDEISVLDSLRIEWIGSPNDSPRKARIEEKIREKHTELSISIKNLNSRHERCNDVVSQWLKKRPNYGSLIELNGNLPLVSLSVLQEKLESNYRTIQQFDEGSGNPPITPPEKESDEREEEKKHVPLLQQLQQKLHEHKSTLSASVVVVILVAVVGLLYFLYPGDTSVVHTDTDPPPKEDYISFVQQGDSLLRKNNYDGAIAKYKAAEEKGMNVDNKINKANNIAVKLIKQEAQNEYNVSESDEKTIRIDCYKVVERILKKTEGYDYDPTDDIAEYKQKTINYYMKVINNTSKLKERKKYADYILKLDPDHAQALGIRDEQKPPPPGGDSKKKVTTIKEKSVEQYFKDLESDIAKGKFNWVEVECQKIIDGDYGDIEKTWTDKAIILREKARMKLSIQKQADI
jgi:hypothetical protein